MKKEKDRVKYEDRKEKGRKQYESVQELMGESNMCQLNNRFSDQ